MMEQLKSEEKQVLKEEIVKNANEERIFLEGPQSRKRDFLFVIKVLSEFIKGFRALHFVGPCATVFGSARFHEDHPSYILSRKMDKAKALLEETDIPINEIAFDLGFESSSNFFQAFKKIVEDTPENYRKKTSINK